MSTSKNSMPQTDSLFDGDAFIAPKYESEASEPHFADKSLAESAQETAPILVTPNKLTKEGIALEIAELNDVLDRIANFSGSTYAIAKGREIGVRPSKAKAPGNSTPRKSRWDKPTNRRTISEKAHADEPPEHIRNQMDRK